jgi:hypothetical protein
MARRVFFSFHYERDVWRANVVRNSWVTHPDIETAGFIDAAEFEKLEREGDSAVKKWINDQLTGTSVTAVLIGYETYSRRWVRYEIVKSFDKNNGLLGIYIQNIKDNNGIIDIKGKNPFEYVGVYISVYGKAKYVEWKNGEWQNFYDYPDCSLNFDKEYWNGRIYYFKHKLYDWVDDNGYNNFGNWVEESARQTGR